MKLSPEAKACNLPF